MIIPRQYPSYNHDVMSYVLYQLAGFVLSDKAQTGIDNYVIGENCENAIGMSTIVGSVSVIAGTSQL